MGRGSTDDFQALHIRTVCLEQLVLDRFAHGLQIKTGAVTVVLEVCCRVCLFSHVSHYADNQTSYNRQQIVDVFTYVKYGTLARYYALITRPESLIMLIDRFDTSPQCAWNIRLTYLNVKRSGTNE
jgi:hypothetical protein